jgi:hypothetical protein
MIRVAMIHLMVRRLARIASYETRSYINSLGTWYVLHIGHVTRSPPGSLVQAGGAVLSCP